MHNLISEHCLVHLHRHMEVLPFHVDPTPSSYLSATARVTCDHDMAGQTNMNPSSGWLYTEVVILSIPPAQGAARRHRRKRHTTFYGFRLRVLLPQQTLCWRASWMMCLHRKHMGIYRPARKAVSCMKNPCPPCHALSRHR